ncbi:ligand-binding sensor domain-containing protein [Taibaiella koreensis]|uniref:ligand-binding sensor domain-containing protein n=1 Tax=Taibaiella koreensis TaxID=1268548 RepID=UPI0013C2B8CC|nr:histidine kinase [Taibaiella koreensis]
MRSLLVILLCCALSSLRTFAQEYSYTHYDTKDGLANSTVYNICQTKDGFIWFCTETGLTRFDGCRFKTFTTTNGLPSNQVLNAWEDSRGRLWLMMFKDAICYYADGKIHNQENDSILKKVHIHASWNAIVESPDGNITVQEANFTHIITAAGKVTTYPWGTSDWDKLAAMLINISTFSGTLPANFVMLPNDIRKAVRPNWIFLRKSGSVNKPYYAFAGTDTLWFVTPSGNERIYAPHSQYRTVFLNDHQYVIYNRLKGVKVVEQGREMTSCSYFTDYDINAVIKDREQNIWFSTQGSGVFKVSPNRFKSLFTKEKADTYICDIHRVGSSICIGTKSNDYWKFDTISDAFFENETKNKSRSFVADDHFLQQLPKQTIFQVANADFLNLGRLSAKFSSGVKTMQSLQDTLLLTNSAGVFLVSIKNKKIIKTLYHERATCAYKQGETYYIGTLKGLYTTSDGSKALYKGTRFPEFKNNISTFAESNDGTLWVGSNGGGVYGYREGKIIAAFDNSTGLSSNMCSSLCASGNKLWVGSEKGLNQIDITPGVYKVVSNITVSDGLNSNIVNSVYVDGSFIYVGTPVGITVFDERKVQTHGICYLNMTDIIVSGQYKKPSQRSLLLKHEENNISFAYSGISFLSGGDITYKYRVLGLDDTWKYTKETVLTYPSLPSGKYTLELIAINKFRNESKPLRYHFEIEKSILETAWFKSVMIIAGIIIIIVIVRYVILLSHRKERKALMADHKMKSLEQMALRAQMNPHFIFNCLNSMQRYIIDGDIKKANFYLSRFAALVRETLDNAARVFITIEEEIRYLTNYIDLERVQIQDAFEYVILIDPLINQAELMIPNMVLQPFVENAIKHGLDHPGIQGKLTVSFILLEERRMLQCAIDDNGPGIKQSMELKQKYGRQFPAKGMSITNQRILTLNQLQSGDRPIRIQVIDVGEEESVGGTGTRIMINLPVKYYDEESDY